MWEFFIESNINDVIYLKNIEKSLKFKNVNVVTALNKNSLSVACEFKDKPQILLNLKKVIAESIVLIYKQKFFESKIDLSYLNEQLKTALIKCLVLFDFEEDFYYVLDKLNLNFGLVLDSFYLFQLKKLEKKWQEIVNICSNNTSFMESETFLELLKFLISSITPKRKSIDVYFNGENFVLCDENNNIIVFNDAYNLNNLELNLISGLITLAPKTINLHCAGVLSDNTFKIIYHIFNKKVNLLV